MILQTQATDPAHIRWKCLPQDGAATAQRRGHPGRRTARRTSTAKRRDAGRIPDIRGRFATDQGERSTAATRGVPGSTLVKELELRTTQMTLLNEMGPLLECSATVKGACAVAANSVQRLFPEALSGALYLFKSSRNLVEAAPRWDTKAPPRTPPSCPMPAGRYVAASRTGASNRERRLLPASGPVLTTQRLCVPMVAQGNTVGVLHLEFGSSEDRDAIQDWQTSGTSSATWR